MKHISIILPTYNVKDMVLNCVRSVMQNTYYLDWNLYIVDDASTDGTFDALRSALVVMPPGKVAMLVRNSENKGCPRAWNRGIRKCLDDWGGGETQHILLISSDIVVYPNWLTTLANIIETGEKVGLATCTEVGGHHEITEITEVNVAVPTSCCLINGKLIEEIGIYDERFRFFYADTLFCYKLLKNGWKIMVTPERLVDHIPQASKYEYWPDNSLYKEIEPKDRKVLGEILREEGLVG